MTGVLSRDMDHYRRVLDGLAGVKVGIVGDAILDVYLYGRPSRLSREAPVPIVEYEGEDAVPGGAANAAAAAAALGARASIFGFIGADEAGERLISLLDSRGVDTSGLLSVPDWGTVTKTRLMAGSLHTAKHQMARIDRGVPLLSQRTLFAMLADRLKAAADRVDALLISDYGYRAVSGEVEGVVKDAAAAGLRVVADSRRRVHDFSRVTAVTPNEEETLEFGRYMLNFESDVERIGEQMLEILKLQAVLVTRGNRGLSLFLPGRVHTVPVAGTADIVDVSGAGDEVAVVFSCALATGCDFETAAELADVAAGVVVMKRGTAVADVEEIDAKLTEVAGGGGSDRS